MTGLIDSGAWTGRNIEGDEYLTAGEWEEIWREERRYMRGERWKAFKMLWLSPIVDAGATRRRSDSVIVHERDRSEEWTLWRAFRATVGLAFGLHFGQRQIDAGWKSYESIDLGFWDARSVYGGYDVMALNLHCWFRVEVFSDGECTM